jgi:two-component system chemotaxis sensor kinase CheA
MTMDDEDLDAQLLAQMREDFLAESQEILDRLEPLLAELEQGGDPDLINTVFRELHTLKSSAAFLELTSMEKLAHRLEDVFGSVRSGASLVSSELIDAAFAGARLLRAMRNDVSRGGSGEEDCTTVLTMLDAIALGGSPAAAEALAPAMHPGPATAPDTTLRVEIETLDGLLALAGELITARNALQAIAERLKDESLQENAATVDRLSRQIETTITTLRLVPVERLFNRFTGVVRNLAREHGKRVRLVIEGAATPLDRTISAQMYDPLIHLLRNAVDHGVELPADRRSAGKPEEATFHLSAERRGDTVVLRIADDGRGIDPDLVRQAAVKRGICTAEQAELLSVEQAIRLIFVPGFSTASSVTNTSGRGVGLDVVLQNVRRLRGTLDVQSVPGQGTAFTIQLPLTLAVLQVLLLRAGGFTYALPLHAVRETLQPAAGSIQQMQGGEVVFVRDTALPVYHLVDCLQTRGGGPILTGLPPAVVVRRTHGDAVLVVDELLGKQQVVIKPLSPYVGALPGVEGAAILPDGSVTLILDLEELQV